MTYSQRMAENNWMPDDEKVFFMEAALDEAKKAAEMGEIPIGAVIVWQGEIIARAHNLRETNQKTTSHAEILAIEQANEKIGSWRLDEASLFVTVEPCAMCAGAILNARIPVVYYGADNAKAGAVNSLYHLLNDERQNHQVHVERGILAHSAGEIMSEFFANRRGKNV